MNIREHSWDIKSNLIQTWAILSYEIAHQVLTGIDQFAILWELENVSTDSEQRQKGNY